jgi:hypothetical protein
MAASAAQPHPSSAKLEDQAAAAAFYVTNSDGQRFLGSNGKLSPAGASFM